VSGKYRKHRAYHVQSATVSWDEDVSAPAVYPAVYGVGLLGATTENPLLANEARLDEIERRILRLERERTEP